VSSSPAVSDRALLRWRASVAGLMGCLSLYQKYRRGLRVARFYTVLSWDLLTLYFALAALATHRRLRGGDRAGGRGGGGMSRLELFVVGLFNMLGTTTLNVCLTTWLVLYPMLRASPEPELRRVAGMLASTPTSWLQHGGNVALLLVDAGLCATPLSLRMYEGFQAVYAVAYIAFAAWLRRTAGYWLYLFLDHSLPVAPVVFLLFYAAHYAFYGAFCVAVAGARRWLHAGPGAAEGRGGRGGGPAAPAAGKGGRSRSRGRSKTPARARGRARSPSPDGTPLAVRRLQ